MTPDFAIAWLLFNVSLITIMLVWGIIRYRRGIWYRKLSLKVQAYLLWAIGGVALLSSMFPFAYLYTEHLWFFENVGYADVFWKIRKMRWGIFGGFFLVAFVFMNVNALIANRLCPEPREFARWTHKRTASFHRGFFCSTVVFAILLAIPMMSLQDTFIRYLERPTDIVEPILFGKDRNFYLFSFPMHKLVSLWVAILLWVTCAVVGLLYNFYYRRDARSKGYVKRNIVFHGSVLWLMLIAIGIWRSYINLWGKVFKPSLSSRFSEFHGLFYADSMLAGATQVYGIILLSIAVVVLLNLFWRKRILWYTAIAISVVSFLCVLHLYPIGVNFWAVRTAGDAVEVEKDFLSKHIRDTRSAFDLNAINEKKYKKGLATLDTIERNAEIKQNIQFWDRRVFYNILRNEQIERHHDFHPYADIDRYRLGTKPNLITDGAESQDSESDNNPSAADLNTTIDSPESVEQYRQMLISAREIDPDPGPKEWGELKLKFTHGYGVCVAPVNEISNGGTPDLWVKGVPISQKEGLAYPELDVLQPRIYYGEMTNEYVIVKTKKPEYNVEEEEGMDEDNESDLEENTNLENVKKGYHYEGTGGVALGGFFRRLCFAVRFTSVFILRNPALLPDSRVMFWRRIGTRRNEKLVTDRLSHIAPFLDYDPDPYIVIDDGQLWWIVDFYVTSDWYPNAQPYADDTAPIEDNELELYAEPRFKRFKKFNYIRNSGVAVVNAYNGNVNFYTDINDEAITNIYQKAFPNLFKSIDEMPEGLKAHRRFPDYLTRIQAKMYGNYHVTDAEKFINKSNQWKISMEAYYSETPNHEMMPYYAMLKLPGEEKAEFVNMIPFTPPKKDNFMKGWLIARCDPPYYGQRIVYTLPDQINVKGPKHVEDDISKDTELAKLFRDLRANNDIIPGNLHIIPIEDGIFYIKPIFIKPKKKSGKNGSEETDLTDPIQDLPTLKTIVVKAADHELAADATFDNALRKMFLRQPFTASVEDEDENEQTPTLSDSFEVLVKAVEEFGKTLKAEQNGKGTPKNAGKKKNNKK